VIKQHLTGNTIYLIIVDFLDVVVMVLVTIVS
jgi:hypothetical protein